MTDQIDCVNAVNLEELRQLAKQDGAWVSISMPTHRTGADTRQDPIRFRNLSSQALGQLAELGVEQTTHERIEQQLTTLGRAHEFWQHQTGGLVVLTSADEQYSFRLPSAVAERAVASIGPALSALVPFVDDDTRFRVLTLSADSVRLLEGTINSLGEVDLGPIPATYDDAFSHVEQQKQLQHSSHPSGTQYHGHGGDASGNATTRYLRAVAAGLDQRLRDEPPAPLLLAGMASLASEFRQISGQPKILDETLTGSHDKTPAHEMHEPAWAIVQAAHTLPLDQANDRINQAWSNDQALLDLTEIVRAAGAGRIDSLFLADGAAADDERIEEALRLTLQMGGEAHTLLDPERRVAALLRY